MKKTLVALAAVAVTTGAMAEATITGSLQAGTNQSSVTTSGAAAVNKLTLGDDNGNTVINIGVSEDLGDGLKFMGTIGIELGNEGSTGLNYQNNGVNETYLGLTGGFGTFKTGALQTPQFLAVANGDAGAGYLIGNTVSKIIQHSSGSTGGTNLIQANSIQYTSPAIIDGLTLKYQTALGELSTDLNGTQYYAADYKSGALTAGIVYSTYKYTAAYNDTASSYFASYNFGPATVKALWGSAQTGGLSDVSGSSVGIQVPVGSMTLMYNLSTNNGLIYATSSGTARTVSSQGQTGNFAGLSYSFSKRTTGFVAYYKETGNNNAYVADSSSSWSTTRFVLIHSF